MSEFEKWWKQYEDDKDICYNSDIGRDAVKAAFAAGQAASAARIAKLEADCKVMAEAIFNAEPRIVGELYHDHPEVKSIEAACIIAAKYREGR